MQNASDGQFVPFISAVFLSLAVAWAVLAFTPNPAPLQAKPVKPASWLKTDKAPDRHPRVVKIEAIRKDSK